MKLSEAILLGSMKRPQAFGGWTVDATCALGSAIDALGGILPFHSAIFHGGTMRYSDMLEVWPILKQTDVPYPHCCDGLIYGLTVGDIIVHLNDHHKWTRPAIAEWVASVEAAEAVTAVVHELVRTTQVADHAKKTSYV